MATVPDARGGDLFRIRRVFSLAPNGTRQSGSSDHHQPSAAAATPLRIEAMAVHSHEKKQLVAMSVAEDVTPPPPPATSAPSAVAAPFVAAAAALATHTIALGQLPSVEPRKSRVPTASTTTTTSTPATTDAERKARAAALLSSTANYLLVRTVEEDEQQRLWKFPVYSNRKQERAGKREKLVALEFSPEGDWLAGLSSRKNRLHLIPVLALIARQRKQLLAAAASDIRQPHTRELMSVHPSVMTTQMASYLRATNEAGGLNGARYQSQVAGDHEQMSTLEFAVGLGTVTCCRWWRAMNRQNYCLVGGSESLISIVNVHENAEECRCELQNAGAIVAIDLVRETFRKETRTTMLVKAMGDDRTVRYYRVVLEKKFQQPPVAAPKPSAPAASLKSVLTPVAATDATAAATATATTSSFASASGTPSFTTASQSSAGSSPSRWFAGGNARGPVRYVVKTFPQHFLEDMDFRPQRIKKNSPQVCLYAINGLLSSQSALALYDPDAQRARLYSNFQWSLRNEYVVPSLAPAANVSPESGGDRKSPDAVGDGGNDNEEDDRVEDVEIAYCTTDLLLLQGRTAKSKQNVSTWVSLPSPSGPDDDDQVATAHIVHYLSLHGNEKIERVVQSTARPLPLASTSGKPSGGGSKSLLATKRFASGSSSSDRVGESQVIYVLQTAHHVYECRPQWSRLALFKALCAQSIALANARSIGYALGIDMASLCQVVAETLCENVQSGKAAADEHTVEWIRDLFQVSRALPSSAIDQLTSIGGARYAIAFAQEILTPTEPSQALSQSQTHYTTPFVGPYERKQVALKLLDLVLREQLRANVSLSSSLNSREEHDTAAEAQLDDKEAWLLRFLETSDDYDTEDVVDKCLAHQHVDKAVLVGRCRQQVRLVLHKIVRAGLASFVSLHALQSLVADGFAPELTRPASRLLLRAFPVDTQVDVLLAHPPAILQQRDWVVRNLPFMTRERCEQIAHSVDPRRNLTAAGDSGAGDAADVRLPDVAASEMMPTLPEERVELFLTALLFLNRASVERQSPHSLSFDDTDNDNDHDSQYTQATLEQLMKELAFQYRPPVVVARCVDYENWTAAACVYEAHGELVEAVEARLQAHKVLRPVVVVTPTSPTTATALPSSPPSLSFSALRRRRQSSDASLACSDESEFQDAMRDELFQLLNTLVVQRHSERAITEEMKAAILARLLVKWFEYGLAKAELEVFLIDPTVYPFVASLLAKIFFSEVVDGILGDGNGGGGSGLALDARSSTPLAAVARGSGFDDRDREWVRMCHRLPFSGQFLFHVCATFLDSGEGDSDSNGDSEDVSLERRSAMLKLLDLVKANVLKNDLALPAVTIEPHSGHALGKSDPLETHVKAFTCGHVFPKRVFDEEIVPEFEKRLATLPMPLFSTRQVLLREFKRDAVEAPCPICAFNKISGLVQQQQQQLMRGSGVTGAAKPLASHSHTHANGVKPPVPAYYFLHAQGQQQHPHGLYQPHDPHRHWRHEAWEWRAVA